MELSRFKRRLLPMVFCAIPLGSVYAQNDGTIELRLQSALGASGGVELSAVSRNHSDLFPSATFYRAWVNGGVHADRRSATVVATDVDTVVVVALEDIVHAWKVVDGEALVENYRTAADSLGEFAAVLEIERAIFELLSLSGLQGMSGRSRIVGDEADAAYVRVRWPTQGGVTPQRYTVAHGRLRVAFLVDSPRSLVRVEGLISEEGDLLLSVLTLASNH